MVFYLNIFVLLITQITFRQCAAQGVIKSDLNHPIIYENYNNGYGDYNFRFLSPDGTERQERGSLLEDGTYLVRGYYTYIDTNGKKVFVEYYADKTGYHPTISVQLPHTVYEEVSRSSAVVASLLG